MPSRQMIALACPCAINLPRKPGADAASIAAMIASRLVAIGDHTVINGAYEGRMSIHLEPYGPLVYGARIGLE